MLCTPVSVAVTIIYSCVGMPMVHIPCIAFERQGGAGDEVESMWAQYNGSSYIMVIARDKSGTKEKFRQLILGGDTIHPDASYSNEHFYGRVNVSASRGLVINNVTSSDAGTFQCRYKDMDTKASGQSEVELIVFNVADIPSSKPQPTTCQSVKDILTSKPQPTTYQSVKDNLNTEGRCNCTVWQALFGGLLGAVLLGFLALWGRIKLCHHNTSQTVDGSCELPTAHNNKGHYAQGEDAVDEKSQVESEGTNGLGWDDEPVMPQAL